MGNSPTKPEQVEEAPREFSLANNNLKLDSAVDVAVYVDAIKRVKNLTVVSLNGNTLGVEAAKALADALRDQTTLREVHLNDCFTGRLKEEVPLAIEAFCRVFTTLPHLTKVDFSDNAFGPVGARAVYEYLSNAFPLQELRLNNNGLGPEGGKLIGEALSNCQQKNASSGRQSSLRRVFIGRNRLENASMEALGKAFEAHSALEELALYQNGIRPDGIVTLSRAIAKCPSLKYIDLQDNTFTATGAAAFADSLAHLPKLVHLNLGDCLLGAVGAVTVLKAIFSADSSHLLHHLNLQYNEMDESGAQLIAGHVSKLGSLKHLFLNGNNFKSEGQTALAIRKAFDDQGRHNVLDDWDDMEADLESDEEDEVDVDEVTVDEVTMDEASADEANIDKASADEARVNKAKDADETPDDAEKSNSELAKSSAELAKSSAELADSIAALKLN